MPTRRTLLAAALFSAAGLPAFAAEVAPFSQDGFAAAQAAGASILVHIFAPWCPTCKAQQPILEKLENAPKFRALKVFHVDFDNQKDVVRQFKATMQSTLIVFKGATETGRSVGDTDSKSIAGLLDKSL
jgi:thioredoxin-like negative regulator of GroEL